MSDFCMGHTMKKRIDALIEQMRQPAPDIRQQAAKELAPWRDSASREKAGRKT